MLKKIISLSLSLWFFCCCPIYPSQLMTLGKIEEKSISHLLDISRQDSPLYPPFTFDLSAPYEPPFDACRQHWIAYFSKVLFENRLTSRIGDRVTCCFFPHPDTQQITGCLLTSQIDTMATIETALFELQDMVLIGVSAWELRKAKEEVWNTLYPHSNQIADQADLILQSITPEDIQTFLSPLYELLDEDLDLIDPEAPSIHLCSSLNTDASIFNRLSLTDYDRETIHWIIHTLAKSNLIQLGCNQKKIRGKGDTIEHVHPLRFLSFIMGEGGLRDDMKKIRKSSFKWNHFIKDYTARLMREHRNGNILPYITGFARSLNLDPKIFISYIERNQWDQFVLHFL